MKLNEIKKIIQEETPPPPPEKWKNFFPLLYQRIREREFEKLTSSFFPKRWWEPLKWLGVATLGAFLLFLFLRFLSPPSPFPYYAEEREEEPEEILLGFFTPEMIEELKQVEIKTDFLESEETLDRLMEKILKEKRFSRLNPSPFLSV